MDIFLRILTILVSIIIPLLILLINNKKDWHKQSNDLFSNNFDNAEKFKKICKNATKYSQLEKDRSAKLLYKNQNADFFDAIYFNEFCDADNWVNQYMPIKSKLDIIRDFNNQIKLITYDYSLFRWLKWFSLYCICISIFAIPYIFFLDYKSMLLETVQSGRYLITFEGIVFPIFFLIIGVLALLEADKINNCKKFVKDFNSRARKHC